MPCGSRTAARGFAVGLTSPGIGTAHAFDANETAGLFAGIAVAINAVATSLVVPLLAVKQCQVRYSTIRYTFRLPSARAIRPCISRVHTHRMNDSSLKKAYFSRGQNDDF
ncbi:LrgB family protein [Pseudaminobacter salicylatoxidans]|uniref:LrgB family protein n=1 Tax=Pseudaminobacter salicylatoxidans TaxID=93369 RepID=UPI0018E08BA1